MWGIIGGTPGGVKPGPTVRSSPEAAYNSGMGVFLGVAGPPPAPEAAQEPTIPGDLPFQHLQIQRIQVPGLRLVRGRNGSPLDPPVYTPAPHFVVGWDGTLLERGSFRSFQVSTASVQALLDQPGSTLARLKGWFALVAYDARQGRLLLATDWMGLRPVFYRWEGKRNLLWFGTLFGPLGPGEPDPTGLLEYFFLNYPLSPRTLHREIHRVPPGHHLVWEPGHPPRVQAYYRHRDRLFHQDLQDNIGRRQVVEAFIETTRSLASESPGLLLTGGFDSRVVLAAVRSVPGVEIQALTFGDPASGNVRTARQVAQQAGARFQNLDPNPVFRRSFHLWARRNTRATDGLEVVTKAHYLWALATLEPPPTVLLSGTGGSELFRQTGVLGTIYSPLLLTLLDTPGDLSLDSLASLPQARWIHLDFFPARALTELREDLAELLALSPGERTTYLHVFNLAHLLPRYFENEMKVEQLFTVKRFPFLDLDFVELVFASAEVSPLRAHLFRKSPLDPLRRLRFYTEVLRRTLPDLARLETDRGIRPDYATSPWGFLRSVLGYWRFKRSRPPGEYRFGEWLDAFPLDPSWPCEPPVRRRALVDALLQVRGTPRAFPAGSGRALTYCVWQELLLSSPP